MILCPTCGKENPDGFAFCGFCTAGLAAKPSPTAEERKIVTVLFCDLVGFTAASDEADPEDVRATLRPYHALLRTEIERYGGTVEKFIGDAVMAVFGAPIAHEDDAERAVRAGLRILEAIEELNEDSGLGLSVRIGINTGEAVVALGAKPQEGEGLVTGDVVNTASRLQGAAPVGGIGVGEGTHRATRDVFDYDELDPVKLKGKAEPVPIWWAKAARSRFGTDLAETVSTPFVGRMDDLDVLKSTFRRAIHEASVQLVTVTGEPGVGKSRLLRELFSFIDSQPELVHWRQGRCLSYGEGITFWALGEIVKAHVGILESDSPEDAASKLEGEIRHVVEDPSDREWMKTKLQPLVGLASQADAGDREESFTAWQRFLEAIAATRPLVLAVEDLHWADQALLEFIEHLVDWASGIPMLVLCTARPELFERYPTWGAAKRNVSTVSLSPLTEAETASLIAALLEQSVLPAQAQRALLERAGGNPLYAEEFVRMLKDQGILQHKGNAWMLPRDAAIPFPDSVQALIAARLDTLPPGRKALLQDAAVVGKVFWSGTVVHMGGVEEEAVRRDLHELSRKELVRPARISSVKDQAEYSFWHVLVRDVVYGQIPRPLRANKHQAAAEWIESTAGERVMDHSEILAFHYRQALELAKASGTDDDRVALEDGARRFLLMAGDRVVGLDPLTAESYYRQALDLVPAHSTDRPEVLVKSGEAAALHGDIQAAESLLQEAIDGFEEDGQRVMRAAATKVSLCDVVRDRGEITRARRILDDALGVLEQHPPGPELARAYVARARDAFLSGRTEESQEWSEKALALCERFDMRNEVARVLQFIGTNRVELGDLNGVENLWEALTMCLDNGLSSLMTALSYINLVAMVGRLETAPDVVDLSREAVEFCEGRGLTSLAHHMKQNLAVPLFELGEWDKALRLTQECLDWDSVQGGTTLGVSSRYILAYVLILRGELAEARSLRDEFLLRARHVGDLGMLSPALLAAALIQQADEDPQGAVGLIEEYVGLTRSERSIRAGMVPTYLDALRALLSAGALPAAEYLLADAEREVSGRRQDLFLRAAKAIVEEGRGHFPEALQLYLEAEERWRECHHVLERGYALFGQGRCLLQLERAKEGIEKLQEAREAFRSLRARPLVAEADWYCQRAEQAI